MRRIRLWNLCFPEILFLETSFQLSNHDYYSQTTINPSNTSCRTRSHIHSVHREKKKKTKRTAKDRKYEPFSRTEKKKMSEGNYDY